MTVNAVDRLTAYRSEHRIFLVDEEHPDFGHIFRCRTDGIRVHPTRNDRWYHDPAELKALLDANYGGPWGSPRVAVAAVTADVAREDAFVNGRLTFERVIGNQTFAIDVDLADDEDEWTNREGMPEFNGSFR
jgi:hypothetical protein